MLSRPYVRSCLTSVLIVSMMHVSAVGATELTEKTDSQFDPTVVFAARGDVELTQIELDGAFTGIPKPARLMYIRDGEKVDQLVIALLQRKAIAADAAKTGFDQDPVIAARVQLAAEKELAEAWLQHMVENAPEADYMALGREDFLLDPESYRSEEVLDLSHILIGTDSRSSDQAELVANQLFEQLLADPQQFDELVREYSDDPSKNVNGGRFPEVRKGQMVESFEKAAFAIEKQGDISKPVRTDYGYHLIRLNGKSGGEIPQFEQVQAEAVQRARVKHLNNIRESYLKRIASDPIVIPEGAVEIMVKRHFGENLELAPTFEE
jgi:hypothetical protein